MKLEREWECRVPDAISKGLFSDDDSAVFHAIRNIKYDCAPEVRIRLLTEFTRRNHSVAATRYAGYMLVTAVEAFFRNYSVIDGTAGDVMQFFDGLASMVPAIRSHGHLEKFIGDFCEQLDYHRAIGQFSRETITEALASPWPPKRFDLLRLVDTSIGATALTDALKINSERSATFYIDRALTALSSAVRGRELKENAKEAFSRLFTDLYAMVPKFAERGHERYLIAGLDALVKTNPELPLLANDVLTAVDPYRRQQNGEVSPMRKKTTVYFGRLEMVASILRDLPIRRQREIAKRFSYDEARRKSEMTVEDKKRAAILEKIFDTDSNPKLSLDEVYELHDVAPSEVADLLSDSVIFDIISLMQKDQKRYQQELGFLLTLLPVDRLPDDIRERIPIAGEVDMNVKPGHEKWDLCGSAEDKLMESLYNGAVVLVNGTILMKMTGKLSGVCLETCTTSNGLILSEGIWYSPIDTWAREAIRKAHDKGITRIDLPSGQWSIMRPVWSEMNKTGSEIFEEVREVAKTLPKKFPSRIYGTSRKKYRNETEEEF